MVQLQIQIWASSYGKDTYHTGKQQRLRQACAPTQSHQSHRCSHTQYRELEEASDKEPHLRPSWVAVHACLKEHKPHDTEVSFHWSPLIWTYQNKICINIVWTFFTINFFKCDSCFINWKIYNDLMISVDSDVTVSKMKYLKPQCTAMKATFSQNTVNVACKKN